MLKNRKAVDQKSIAYFLKIKHIKSDLLLLKKLLKCNTISAINNLRIKQRTF